MEKLTPRYSQIGGTNAHVVLERAPFLSDDSPDSADSATQARKLFILSANDKNALEAMMKNIGIYLEQRPEIFQNDLMSNVAYTLGQRRSLLQWRVAIAASSSFELIQSLNSGKVLPIRETEPLRIGFIFTGQGAQFAQMGWGLYEHYPVFAETIDACDRYLTSLGSPFSLTGKQLVPRCPADVLTLSKDELRKEAESSRVNEAHISQPACTAIQLALTDLLRSWDILPTAVTGHSSGEIGAAYAAGILPLKSCMAIAYYRGMVTTLLKKKFPNLRGSMMAVGCSKEEIEPLIAQLVAKEARVACYNSPSSLTISGDEPAIDELQSIMEKSQLFNRKLQVEMAYHSHHMELVAKDYIGCLQNLDAPVSTEVKFHSSLLGHLVDGSELQPSYWVENLTQSVRFSEALTNMCQPVDGFKTGVNMLVEIGPHSALGGPVKQILKSCGPNAMKIPYTSALVRKRDAVETTLELASTLFTKGATLEMGAVNVPSMSKKPSLLVDMPRYPWNHQTRYWHEPRVMQKHKGRKFPRHDLLGTLATYSNDLEPTWRNILRVDDLPWLRHHKIQSLVLFPMSGFVSMAVEAASQRAAMRDISYESFELRDVSVNTPLMVTDDDVEMTLQLRAPQDGTFSTSENWDEFRIHSWTSSKGWTEHCKGLIAVKSKCQSSLSSSFTNVANSDKLAVEKSQIYDSLSDLGVSYGPTFQGMNSCQANDTCSVADIMTVDTAQDMPKEFQTDSIIHPALLEQLIEMYWPILGAGRAPINTVYLPSSIGVMNISRRVTEFTKTPGDSLHAVCRGSRPLSHPRPIKMSMIATASKTPSEPLITVEDLTIAPIIERDTASENEVHRDLCYKLDWEPAFETENALSITTNGNHEHTNGVNGNSNGVTNTMSNGASDFSQDNMVIIRGDSEEQIQLSTRLADLLTQKTKKTVEIGTLHSVETKGKICLFLSEIHKPLLSTLTQDQFICLQQVLTNVQGILWAVRGAYVGSSSPESNMVTGLSRSIRSETLLKFATLDLDSESPLSTDETAKAILEVLKATFGAKAEANCELEFMERKGAFSTPRIINDPEMNEYVHKQTKASILEPTIFSQEDRSLQLAIQTPGALETLHFVDQSASETLADDEIEIQVKAIGMNGKDLLTAMGQLDSFEFGSECSGAVVRIGQKVKDFVAGDRVACLSTSGGVYSTFARSKSSFALKVNDTMTFEEAASIPMAYFTAHYGLVDLARLETEEIVLIHGAATASGQAAMRLAQGMGAKVSTIVHDADAKDLLMKEFGLLDEQVILHNASRAQKSSFDVVLNCVSTDTETLREMWGLLSNFGRFIELGSTSSRLETTSLGNRSFMSVDIMSLASQRPKIMSRLVSDLSKIMKSGSLQAVKTTVFPILDIETAFKALQSGNFDGKLIVSPRASDQVKVRISSSSACSPNQNTNIG
jgi:acyl transferase domain-containing protein/NADPH:quinone reductase-like Zn-dependent oxidoreductase